MIKFAFGFPSPKRGRKPSGERQAETKRPRSPGRQDELQGEQHGAAATMEENTAMLKEMDKKRTHMFTFHRECCRSVYYSSRCRSLRDELKRKKITGLYECAEPCGG